ncbi:MAG: hypothetical protein ACI9XO_001793 [Paraglaciecola sp.]|jgi:hypothetical protein
MKLKFQDFLLRFPEVELPVTLSDETLTVFSNENPPINSLVAHQFINVFEDTDMDDMTEYVPCFKIPKTENFHAVVFWKAGLLNYQFVLMTYDKSGNFIDSRTLAGTTSNGELVIKSVATFGEDWSVYIVSGAQDTTAEMYDAGTSTTTELELAPDGVIH